MARAINGNTTINAVSGTFSASGTGYANARVFTVTSFSLNNGQAITINGNGTDLVVINFPASVGNINFNGNVILNGISPDNVVFNFVGGNSSTLSGGGTLQINTNGGLDQGIFLNPNGKIGVAGSSNVYGRLFGGDSQDFQFNGPSNLTAPLATPTADLQITKTDNKTTAVPGTTDTYTIVATNAGSSGVTGATVADIFPAIFTGVTWTATATGGATGFSANGGGNLNESVTMPVGSTITYLVTGTISATATGSLSNTATVAAPAGVTDTNTSNNSATDTDTLTPQADLQITKTDNKTMAVPGTSDTYTIVVTNAGPSNVTGATVADTFPASFTNVTWTATAKGGPRASRPAAAATSTTRSTCRRAARLRTWPPVPLPSAPPGRSATPPQSPPPGV